MAERPPLPRSVAIQIGGDVSGGITVVEGVGPRRLSAREFGASKQARGYLRMLALLASPVASENGKAPTAPTLDVWGEWERLRRALGTRDAVTGEGPPWAVIRLAPPTLEALGDVLTGSDPGYQVLHLGCHGNSDGVAIEDPLGREEFVATTRLVETLRGSTVRLVVLNACRTEEVARALVEEAGVPAVLATEEPILDAEAAVLAERLYRRLGAGTTVAEALEAVREGIRDRIERGDLRLAAASGTAEERCANLKLVGDEDLRLRLDDGSSGAEPTAPTTEALFVLDPTPHNDPLPLDRVSGFVGRHAERLRLARWLQVTGRHAFALDGVGGIGKTALALEAALRGAHAFRAFAFATAKAIPDFGPLHALRAIAGATGEPLRPEEAEAPVPALTRRLNSAPILLVLDNLESVADAESAALARALAGVDPRNGSRVLLTLRPRQKGPLLDLAAGKNRLRLDTLDRPSALRLAWEEVERQGLERFEEPEDPELTSREEKKLSDLACGVWLSRLSLPWVATLDDLATKAFRHPAMIRLAVALVAEKGWSRARARLQQLRGKEIEGALQELIGTMVDDLEERQPKALEVLQACKVFVETAPLRNLRHLVLGEALEDHTDAAIAFEDGPLQAALDSNLLTEEAASYSLDPTVRAYLEAHRPTDPGTERTYRLRHAEALVPHLKVIADQWLRGQLSLAALPGWPELTAAWSWLADRPVDDSDAAEILRAHSRHWNNLLRNTFEPNRLTWLRAAEKAHEKAEDRLGRANTLQAIGDVLAFQKLNDDALQRAGQDAEARPYFERAALFHEIGMPEQAAPAEAALEHLGDED